MFRRRRTEYDEDGNPLTKEGDNPIEDNPLLNAGGDLQYGSDPEDDSVLVGAPREARADGGPWDAGEPYPERDRVDLGSLLVPVGPGFEIQLVMAEQHGAWVTARYGESELQVQAFAAARNDALWDDVRSEIATEIATAGGRATESDGVFGVVLDAEVPADPADPASGLRAVRFVGVDGPRWFLRGLFSGPAAVGGGDADVLEDVFRDVVVNRGDHPVPPRDLLELRLPPEAMQAMAEQQAAEQAAAGQQPEPGQQPAGQQPPTRDWGDINPFDRGPEFTETR